MTLYINITWIYDENQIKAPAAQETLHFFMQSYIVDGF